MPYVDDPLTFDHKTGRVTITHGFSAIEFLKYCTLQARNDGRPTMGNASPGDFLEFVAPWLDMGGAGENYEYEPDFAGLRELRAVMYQKPLAYLNNKDFADPSKAEAAINRLLLYACYPGATNVAQLKSQRNLYRAYIPLYNALGAAGWQPIPYAQVTPPTSPNTDKSAKNLSPWCERFGDPAHGYFFAIRNPAGASADLTLKLHLQPLGIERATLTAITGCQIKSATADEVILTIPAAWTAVLACNRPDAQKLRTEHLQALAKYHEDH
jgi:hypothetical protein